MLHYTQDELQIQAMAIIGAVAAFLLFASA